MITSLLAAILFLLIVSILWRLSSRRYVLPCPSWLGWLLELDNPLAKIHKAKSIVSNLDFKEGMSVIDIGCGPGRVTIPLAKAVGPSGKVTAMDIQFGMLERTKAKATALNLTNITFLQAGIGEGRLVNNTYDRVVLVTVLGEIPDQKAAIREIYNALKPGGILSITEMIFDPHFQRRSTVRQLACVVGFREKHCFGNSLVYTINFEKP